MEPAERMIAYHWPGPLHEGNGTVKPYFDPATTEEQLGALGQILTGQAGGQCDCARIARTECVVGRNAQPE